MNWMDFIGKVAGPLITAFSVLFAVYVYRRKVDSGEFLALRQTLATIRTDLVHVTNAIQESGFFEIAASIAAQVARLLPPDYKPEDLKALFQSQRGKAYVLTAINLGIEKSTTAKRIRDITERLRRAPHLHRSHLPLYTSLLDHAVKIACQSVEFLARPAVYQVVLIGETAIKQSLPRLQKVERTDLVEREITEAILDISIFGMEDLGNPVFVASSVFTDTLVGCVLRKNDKQLRKQRKLDQKSQKDLGLLPDGAAERLDVLLQPIREAFTPDEWDTLIDAKARLAENLMKADRAEVSS